MDIKLRKEQRQNLISGIVTFLFGLWIFAGSFSMTGVGRSGEPGPSLLPRIVGGLILFLSALLLTTTVAGLRKPAPESKKAATPSDKVPADKKSILLTFALLVFYMFTLNPLGFIISSIIFVFAQEMVMANKPTKKQIIIYAIVAVVTPVLMNAIFVNVFDLMLPAGLLR